MRASTQEDSGRATQTAWQAMRAYVGFTDADSANLTRALPVVLPHFPAIAEDFYDRTREDHEAHAVFTDEAQIERLKRSLVRWLDWTFRGPHDESFALAAGRIGITHQRVGVPSRFMTLAMSGLRMDLTQTLEHAGIDRHGEIARSMHRLLDLELTLMLDAYFAKPAVNSSNGEVTGALDLVDVMVVGLDPAFVIQSVSTEVERLTGMSRDELVGKAFLDALIPPNAREGVADALVHAKKGKRTLLTIDGLDARAQRPLVVRWQFVATQEDGVVALGRDRTEDVALSERMRRAERLAGVGALAAGLAHEIRNPLNGAALHLKVLNRQLERRNLNDPDMTESLEIVAREIARLSTLVTEFLQFARPHTLDKHATDLREVCARVVAVLQPELASSSVNISLDLPKHAISVEVDDSKIEQVLMNLVRNPAEAFGETGGNIVVRTRRKPAFALIEIEDDGPGIPAGAPVFDPFFTTKATGSGLGLPIANRIVSDHLGTLSFDSAPGRTIFRIQLPFDAGAPASRRSQ